MADSDLLVGVLAQGPAVHQVSTSPGGAGWELWRKIDTIMVGCLCFAVLLVPTTYVLQVASQKPLALDSGLKESVFKER